MRLLLLISLFLVLSCAQKTAPVCPDPNKVMTEYSSRPVPKEFRVYGILHYGPLRLPMMLAKFDGFYTVRVAKAKKVSVDKDRLCIEDRCYLLPAPPENLIFGKLLSGRETYVCREGNLLFEERIGPYLKKVLFEGERPREVIVWNPRKGKGLKIFFGKESEEGFFREIRFDTGTGKVKLQIEEVEI